MALFDVYVEGATDPSPQALQRLAEVMAQRYGLPAAELASRMAKGRFRVKANVDEYTAQTYVNDLEAVGARVALVEARGASTLPPPRPAPTTKPPPHPALVPPRERNESRAPYSLKRESASSLPQRSPGSSLPPANEPRPQPGAALPPATAPRPQPGSSLPPAPGNPATPAALPPRSGASLPPANQPYASGLAAAFHEDTPVPELSAFDKDMSVGALDGGDAMQVETSPVLPASIGPATKPAVPQAKPSNDPVDLFAPPEAQRDDFKVELAADEIAHRERKRTPPPGVPVAVAQPASSPLLRPKHPSLSPERSAGVRLPSTGDDEAPRWRFAAGVLASVVLGFIPASCVQSCREDSAFAKIDEHVATVQHQAATSAAAPIPFAQLDAFREEQLAKKKSERRNIAMVSMLIWALGGAGIGYVWFRRVPWDKITFGS